MGTILRRRVNAPKKVLYLHKVRFYPAGNYTWEVPAGTTKVDVFAVGGGGYGGGWYGGGGGGGGGQCVTTLNYAVTPGSKINIVVGGSDAASSFGSVVANGGRRGSDGTVGTHDIVGNGGAAWPGSGAGGSGIGGSGTVGDIRCRDFGEAQGGLNAGGGGAPRGGSGARTSYGDGSGANGTRSLNSAGTGGGGFGGGGGGGDISREGGAGGAGTVLIRFYSYQKP